jgi:hypothetical protein
MYIFALNPAMVVQVLEHQVSPSIDILIKLCEVVYKTRRIDALH